MANIEVPIKIEGLDFVKGLVVRCLKDTDFSNATEEYKDGFLDFANALISTIDKIKDTPTADVADMEG